MQKDPYIILGLTNEATLEEVENAYRSLRQKYSNLRFEEGEIGANASKMLGQIEIAYKDCLDDLRHKNIKDTYNGNAYGEIEATIKSGKLEDAQSMLDKCDIRDAEWHYYQAQIYYKRQWYNEAKNQLEIACDLDTENSKYKTTLEKLENVINRENGNFQQSSGENVKQDSKQESRAGYSRPNTSNTASDSDACCNACSSLICADCCCECMGGDLIPCC